MRHAGIGWPNGATDNTQILALPSPDLLMLSSEHWHYDEAVDAGKNILCRGMARQGFRPAEVGWNARKYVDEILRDWQRVNRPIEQFAAWNELNLQEERGDRLPDHGDLTDLFKRIGDFTADVLLELSRRDVTRDAILHYGAFAPKDETDYIELWAWAAETFSDAVDVHGYGHGPGIIGHIEKYAALFPGKPIELTEWHSDFDGPEMDRGTLALLANYAAVHRDFRAYYFLWRWDGAPQHQQDMARAIAVEGNPDRLALFRDPPTASLPEPVPEPIPEVPPMPTTNPWKFFSAEQIVAALDANRDNVQIHWPEIAAQIDRFGIYDRATTVAALATIKVEVGGRFEPISEYADGTAYEGRADLGNVNPGDGPRYRGRGILQLTGRSNYRWYGEQLQVPLEDMPDEALHPTVSAAVLALYFKTRNIPEMANRGDWHSVRRAVNGGLNGWDVFWAAVRALGGVGEIRMPILLPYNPDAPIDVQPDDWSCSVQSAEFLLRSIGRNPSDQWIQDQLLGAGIVTREHGLMDARGQALAHWLQVTYGDEMGIQFNAAPVTFDEVWTGAGLNPTIVGGRGWNHWSGVRRRNGNGTLALANPAPGFKNVGDRISREQWNNLGPFSAIYIDRGSVAPAPEPDPQPEPVPAPSRAAVLIGEIEDRLAELRQLVA